MSYALQFTYKSRPALAALAFAAVAGCTADSAAKKDEGGGSTDELALSATLSSEVTVASPTAANTTLSGSLSAGQVLSVRNSHALPEPPPGGFQEDPEADFVTKHLILERMLNPRKVEDCRFKPDFKPSPPSAGCYGPKIFYNNANLMGSDVDPDGPGPMLADNQPTDFDMPTGFANYAAWDGGPLFMLLGGDLGIWDANNSRSDRPDAPDEACSAAKIHSDTVAVSGMMNSAIGMAASLRCYAAFNGYKADPEPGEVWDLAKMYQGQLGDVAADKISISAATIERQSNDEGGAAAFVTKIGIDVIDADSPISGAQMDFSVKHLITGDDTFRGKISFKVLSPSGGQPPPGTAPLGRNQAFSVRYEKTAADAMKMHLRYARLNTNTQDPFDASGFIDFAKTAEWGNDGRDIVFNLNPDDGTGQFQFAWQAGGGDSHTRTFLAELKADGTGLAYFGFGSKVSTADTGTDYAGRLQGMWCSWLSHNPNGTPYDGFQKQVLAIDAGTGIWKATASNIKYAPMDEPGNDCSYLATMDSGNAAFWSAGLIPLPGPGNDVFGGKSDNDRGFSIAPPDPPVPPTGDFVHELVDSGDLATYATVPARLTNNPDFD